MTRPPLDDGLGDIRIRSGQRKLIFAVANKLGLRDVQLHDLVEAGSNFRTRAIASLTVGEARTVIGTLKRMERNQARLGAGPRRRLGASDAIIRLAARRTAHGTGGA